MPVGIACSTRAKWCVPGSDGSRRTPNSAAAATGEGDEPGAVADVPTSGEALPGTIDPSVRGADTADHVPRARRHSDWESAPPATGSVSDCSSDCTGEHPSCVSNVRGVALIAEPVQEWYHRIPRKWLLPRIAKVAAEAYEAAQFEKLRSLSP